MIRSALGKVAWVGRTASMVFGLALVMALLFGAVSVALAGNLDPLKLGSLKNSATRVTGLTGNVDGAAALRVTNPNSDFNDTALDLRVQEGEAPMAVNSAGKVANLNVDRLDGNDSSDFLGAQQGLTTDNVAKLANTFTFDYPSLAPGACNAITSGGLAGSDFSNDIIVATPDSNISNQLTVQTRVSATNDANFTIVLCSFSSSSIDPPSASFNLAVFDQP